MVVVPTPPRTSPFFHRICRVITLPEIGHIFDRRVLGSRNRFLGCWRGLGGRLRCFRLLVWGGIRHRFWLGILFRFDARIRCRFCLRYH